MADPTMPTSPTNSDAVPSTVMSASQPTTMNFVAAASTFDPNINVATISHIEDQLKVLLDQNQMLLALADQARTTLFAKFSPEQVQSTIAAVLNAFHTPFVSPFLPPHQN